MDYIYGALYFLRWNSKLFALDPLFTHSGHTLVMVNYLSGLSCPEAHCQKRGCQSASTASSTTIHSFAFIHQRQSLESRWLKSFPRKQQLKDLDWTANPGRPALPPEPQPPIISLILPELLEHPYHGMDFHFATLPCSEVLFINLLIY